MGVRRRSIDIRYEDVPDGGRITYMTRGPALVRALHAWFDAQLTDQGANATTTAPQAELG